MTTTRPQQGTTAGGAAAAVAKQPNAGRAQSASDTSRKVGGYGLPCAKCHLYYPADLDSCPTCHHKERESVVVAKIPPKAAQAATDPVPNNALLEKEREEFLRQFKSQLLETHGAVANGAGAACRLEENHPRAPAVAEICGCCHEKVQERLDACEAALQIDLAEAAQIVYDAVWANASDASKTYQNAASALLTELRKRAGISAATGPFPPVEQ